MTIPLLTTVDEAAAKLRELAETHDWVYVFWDRGWGDHGEPAEITIVVDGDGQDPKARITADVYRQLREQNVVAANTYGGYKARRVHDFKCVFPPPSPRELAARARQAAGETLCHELVDTVTDVPLAAEFGVYPQKRRVGNGLAAAHRYVLMIPTCSDIIVSPYNGLFGSLPAAPGEPGGAIPVTYPYDPAAVAGAEFRARLDAVIREQFVHLEAVPSS